ncbi:hypothetical protein, partial [Pedosphaera parvula]
GVERGKIDREQVVALLKTLEDASRELEAGPILDQLAEDAAITIQLNGTQGNIKLHFDRKEYESYLKQGLAVTTSYVVEHAERKITIAGDGQTAEVSEILLERSTVGGKRLSCKSRQTARLGLRGGKLLIQHLDADVLSIKQTANALKNEPFHN